MARPRESWTNDRETAECLRLERRAMRALVGRLMLEHLPVETVRRLCYTIIGDVVRTGPLFPERPGTIALVADALDSVGTLIDEMVERPEGDVSRRED
jgi:hypothetical protein